jgi:hypothetical protein
MQEVKNGNGSGDDFLGDLEQAIRKIITNRKSSKADKLSAINAGVRLAQVRHKVNGGEDSDKGFFSK